MSEQRLSSADAGADAPRHLALIVDAPSDPAARARRPDEPVLRAGIRAGVIGFLLVAGIYTVVGVIAGLGIGGGLGVGVFVGIFGGVGWGAMAGTSLLVMRDHGHQHIVANVPVQGHHTTRRES